MSILKDLWNLVNEQDDEPLRKKQEKPKQREFETRQHEKDLEDLFRRSQQSSLGGEKGQLEPAKPKTEPKQTTSPKLKTAGAKKTRAAVGKIQPSEEMIRKLSSIDHTEQDIISDEEAMRRAGVTTGAEPKPPTPTTLPAVINKQIAIHGEVVPEWHMVKHLPGYLSSAIRSIGRAVFAPFTRTPIEDIQVIATLGGQGPNEARELNAVSDFLRKNATRDREAEIIFHDKIPDYGADIKVFKTSNITFMLVKDFAGHYIYAWPTSDEKALSHSENQTPVPTTKRLK